MSSTALLVVTTLIAGPIFIRGASSIDFGSPAFATQWNSVEAKSPNFWGPANQPASQEAYAEASGGERLVQYFDKARMEQTTTGGPVTNGLLTVELISGQRQFGDNTFTAYPPANIAVVGDPTNAFPLYSSLNTPILPPKVAQGNKPNGTVLNANGILDSNDQLAAYPGAAFGSYQSDPGGKYAHNVPLAFWTFLSTLPVPWQSAMGYPLTDAFWVNVQLNNAPTWIMVQPFERRVLSYTPTNKAGFQVEMGNIGQHYYQWRYQSNPGGVEGPATATPAFATSTPVTTTCTSASDGISLYAVSTATATSTSTSTVGTATPTVTPCPTQNPCATATPAPSNPTTTATATFTPTPVVCDPYYLTATAQSVAGVEIFNERASVTDTTFTISYNTNLPATSYILYGTDFSASANSSDPYQFNQQIASSQTTSHSTTLSNLTLGTTYYFDIRVDSTVDGIYKGQDNFTTTGSLDPGTATAAAQTATAAAQPASVQTATAQSATQTVIAGSTFVANTPFAGVTSTVPIPTGTRTGPPGLDPSVVSGIQTSTARAIGPTAAAQTAAAQTAATQTAAAQQAAAAQTAVVQTAVAPATQTAATTAAKTAVAKTQTAVAKIPVPIPPTLPKPTLP